MGLNSTKRAFQFNLEGLRGFAAFVVVWHHLILHPYWLDPHYKPTGIMSFIAPGHFSVLIFFVLSGYVIGLNHAEPLNKKGAVVYLKKRFLRIYPIYLISILAAFIVAKQAVSLTTLSINLGMLQNWLGPVIMENNPAWSLNYEVLFYLLFIPFSFFRLNIVLVTLAASAVGLLAYSTGYFLSSSYTFGFVFWLFGVLLARYFQQPTKPNTALMISMLFLIVSLARLNVLSVVLTKIIKYDNPDAGLISYNDFSYLPYCLLIILIFINKDFAFRRVVTAVLLLLPSYNLLYILRTPQAMHDPSLIIPCVCYVVALVVFLLQNPLNSICTNIMNRIAATGSISYGLYIIHFPIIAVFARINYFSGTATTFAVRLLLYIPACCLAAYFLEKKWQPFAVRQLRKTNLFSA